MNGETSDRMFTLGRRPVIDTATAIVIAPLAASFMTENVRALKKLLCMRQVSI